MYSAEDLYAKLDESKIQIEVNSTVDGTLKFDPKPVLVSWPEVVNPDHTDKKC